MGQSTEVFQKYTGIHPHHGGVARIWNDLRKKKRYGIVSREVLEVYQRNVKYWKCTGNI